MRRLIWVVLLIMGLYGGYWFVASRAALSGIETALADLRAEGRADYEAVALRGFPSRFDVTITAPQLVSPDGRAVWTAEFLQLFALSYRPNHVIIVWPKAQNLTVDGLPFDLTNEDLRASVAMGASTALPLEHAELEGHGLSLDLAGAGRLSADKLILATRKSAKPLAHDLALVAHGVSPDPALKAILDPGGALPEAAEELHLRATATFDQAIEFGALKGPVGLLALDDIDLRLGWGGALLTVTGSLARGADGFAEGDVTLATEDWERLFGLLTATGVVPSESAGQLEQILSVMAQGATPPGSLSVPLHFEAGAITLGGFFLAPAPRF